MPNKEFGGRLLEIMRTRRLRLGDVGDAVKRSPQAVHKWIAGGDIEHETLKTLATFLNVNWIALRYGEEELEAACREYMADIADNKLVEIIDDVRRYEEIIDALNIGIWERDPLRNRVYWNGNIWEMMTGQRQPAQWIDMGLNFFDACVLPEDLQAVDRRHEWAGTTAKDGDIYVSRFRAKHDPGTWLYSLGVVKKDSNGRLVKIIGFRQRQSDMTRALELMMGNKKGATRAPLRGGKK